MRAGEPFFTLRASSAVVAGGVDGDNWRPRQKTVSMVHNLAAQQMHDDHQHRATMVCGREGRRRCCRTQSPRTQV